LEAAPNIQMFQEKVNGRSFQNHAGLRPFGQAAYELGHTIAVEIVRDNQVLLDLSPGVRQTVKRLVPFDGKSFPAKRQPY
jgi:hypothetical protein